MLGLSNAEWFLLRFFSVCLWNLPLFVKYYLAVAIAFVVAVNVPRIFHTLIFDEFWLTCCLIIHTGEGWGVGGTEGAGFGETPHRAAPWGPEEEPLLAGG